MAHKEETKAKQRVLTKQAATRTMLESQLADIAKDKAAAREAKRQEALELKKNIRQYEEEEVQKWQQHKEQQAKTKLMYSQQVRAHCNVHSVRKVALQGSISPIPPGFTVEDPLSPLSHFTRMCCRVPPCPLLPMAVQSCKPETPSSRCYHALFVFGLIRHTY